MLITIFDVRCKNVTTKSFGDSQEASLELDKLLKFVKKEFSGKWLLTTTNRVVLCESTSQSFSDEAANILNLHRSEISLYLLTSLSQTLNQSVLQDIIFTPHHDTISKGGLYEYYSSAGLNSLSYAFAELVDNSISATASNKGRRDIEIRLHLENEQKSWALFIDNGHGMSPQALTNWATYRLSKYNRDNQKRCLDNTVNEAIAGMKDAPRFLNSDISFFGVGGKQAVFFIGNSVQIMTKTSSSPDVHELCMSEAQFESKAERGLNPYAGQIRNRALGDRRHVEDCEMIADLIAEESSRGSNFTVIAVSGIAASKARFLKSDPTVMAKQLAHTYHYYLHGAGGQHLDPNSPRKKKPATAIDITIVTHTRKSDTPLRQSLREVTSDRETLLINSSHRSFEFRADTPNGGVVEGVLRYHPFLYNEETFPTEVDADADREESGSSQVGRGSKPIFEAYWNGRLIPYTTIDSFPWCATPKKSQIPKNGPPQECYLRVSGTLWTDSSFQVTTNKLTFMDLEAFLIDKKTVFKYTGDENKKGQRKERDIAREYASWLKTCHDQCDKQVRFFDFVEFIHRPDQRRGWQESWGVYGGVDWDGIELRIGQLVRTKVDAVARWHTRFASNSRRFAPNFFKYDFFSSINYCHDF